MYSVYYAELAEQLGVSQAQVSRDENNEYHGISIEKAQRILEVFNTRIRMEIEGPISFYEDTEYVYNLCIQVVKN